MPASIMMHGGVSKVARISISEMDKCISSRRYYHSPLERRSSPEPSPLHGRGYIGYISYIGLKESLVTLVRDRY